MLAGKTYPFHLSLTNPLYDPIQVRLAVQRQQLPIPVSPSDDPTGTPAAPRRPHFAVSLPSGSFAIAPFAEAWEYEDDEEMFGIEDEDPGVNASPTKSRGETKTVGVLEKKAIPETMSFSFYTVVHLGTLVPREEIVPTSLDS